MLKLFIYDTGDEDNKDQAEERFSKHDMILRLPVANHGELTAGLDRLLAEGRKFDRVLFQTHGDAGSIKFGEDWLDQSYFSASLPSRGIHDLFPFYTRIYFDGCEVGADDAGTDFVMAVGNGLLKNAGGEVLTWTSPGYAFSKFWLPPGTPGGRTYHFWGSVKRAYFGVGGRLTNPPGD